MSDLPDYRPFTRMLIGAWWPAPPTQPADAVGFWFGHQQAKQEEAEYIRNLATLLGQNNSGQTAEDMLTRLTLGRNRLLDVAHGRHGRIYRGNPSLTISSISSTDFDIK